MAKPEHVTKWPHLTELVFEMMAKRKRSQIWMAKRLGIHRHNLCVYKKKQTLPMRHVATFKKFLRIPRSKIMAAIRKDLEI